MRPGRAGGELDQPLEDRGRQLRPTLAQARDDGAIGRCLQAAGAAGVEMASDPGRIHGLGFAVKETLQLAAGALAAGDRVVTEHPLPH